MKLLYNFYEINIKYYPQYYNYYYQNNPLIIFKTFNIIFKTLNFFFFFFDTLKFGIKDKF